MQGTDRPIIGVMGASECDAEVAELGHRVGRLVAERGAALLCGGRGGVMEAAARGAREAGGLTIGILKDTHRRPGSHNRYLDIAIRTGLADARNWINACAADALIAISGGWGTLSEIALARKIGKPVVLLRSWRLASDQDVEMPPAARTPEEAVELTFASLPTPEAETRA